MKHSRTYLLVQASAAVDKAIAEPGQPFGLDEYRAMAQRSVLYDKLYLWIDNKLVCKFDIADRAELQAMLVDTWTLEQEMTA